MQVSRTFFTTIVITIILSGCAVVKTNLAIVKKCVDKNDCKEVIFEPPNNGKGITYFLPRRLMRVTAERTASLSPTVTQARAALQTATTNLSTAVQNATRAANDHTAAQNDLELANSSSTPAPTEADIARLNSAILSTSIALQRANQSRDTAQASVASANANLAGALAGSSSPDRINLMLELLPAEADPRVTFYARPRHLNPLRDDTTQIEVNERGLLSSSRVESTDRTADILAEIAGIAGAITNPASLLGRPGRPERASAAMEKACPELPIRFEKVFDPLDRDQVDKINLVLMECFARELVVTDGYNTNVNSPVNPTIKQFIKSQYSGYLYRASLPYVVTLNRVEKDKKTIAEESVIAMLPNNGPIGFIPIKSSFLVRTVNDVEFNNGSISSWERDRPSEVLEVVRLPIALLREFLSVPTDLIQLRVNLENQESNLLEAQRLQIQANETLRDLRDCIQAASNNDQPVSSCISTTQ